MTHQLSIESLQQKIAQLGLPRDEEIMHISDQLAIMKHRLTELSADDKKLLSQVLEELRRIDRFLEIYKESTASFLKFKYDSESNEWKERLNLWGNSTEAEVLIFTQDELVDMISQCSSFDDMNELSFSIYIETYIEKIKIYSKAKPNFLDYWYKYMIESCEKLEEKKNIKFLAGKLSRTLNSKLKNS